LKNAVAPINRRGRLFDGMDIVISELRSDKELLRKRH